MLLGASMVATCETFVMAQKLGLDLQTFFDISSKASGQCWSMTSYCPVPGVGPETPADRDYEGGFAAALMLKDLRLAMEAAQSVDAYTPMGAEAEELYARFADLGGAGKDFSAIIKMIDDSWPRAGRRRHAAVAERRVGAIAAGSRRRPAPAGPSRSARRSRSAARRATLRSRTMQLAGTAAGAQICQRSPGWTAIAADACQSVAAIASELAGIDRRQRIAVASIAIGQSCVTASAERPTAAMRGLTASSPWTVCGVPALGAAPCCVAASRHGRPARPARSASVMIFFMSEPLCVAGARS